MRGLRPSGVELWGLVLAFLVGASDLVYEVLFQRRLELLIGSNARATALTLACLFAGLAAGSAFWGRRAATSAEPLRLFARLELGVALTAAATLGLERLYVVAREGLWSALGSSAPGLLALKTSIAASLLLPPAFFMGGTFPALSQWVVRRLDQLGRRGASLYGAATLGAALGVLGSGFVLPPLVGYLATHGVNTGINVLVIGLASWLAGRQLAAAASEPEPPMKKRPRSRDRRETAASNRTLLVLAALSGAATLALQVLLTRMFSLVVESTTYAFAIVLAVFLAALGLGAWLARALGQRFGADLQVLHGLIVAGAVAVAAVPLLFQVVTGRLQFVASGRGFQSAMLELAAKTGLVVLPTVALLGAVLPSLLRWAERLDGEPGEIVGRLLAVNTLAGAAGALLAGFAALPRLGLWRSIFVIAWLYLAAAVFLTSSEPGRGRGRRLALVALAAVVSIALGTLPELPLMPLRSGLGERILAVWQGPDGVVAAVESRGGERSLRLNGNYNLGGTDASADERRQAALPLVVHPGTKSVFLIGLGTGITAGAALDERVERVVVSELIPEVLVASELYFGDHTNGLFTDPRATLLPEDGRLALAASGDTYDLVIGDLFLPWNRGIGALYSLEHLRTVASRLTEGGQFWQWLPAHQISEQELFILVRTMLEVFPQVTLWRGDLRPREPAIALVAERSQKPLDPATLVRSGAVPAATGAANEPLAFGPLLLYAGNLAAAADRLLPAGTPINTLDRPRIELLSGRRARGLATGEQTRLSGSALVALFEAVLEAVPPERDPYLALASDAERDRVETGLLIHRAHVLRAEGRTEEALRLMQEAMSRLED